MTFGQTFAHCLVKNTGYLLPVVAWIVTFDLVRF